VVRGSFQNPCQEQALSRQRSAISFFWILLGQELFLVSAISWFSNLFLFPADCWKLKALLSISPPIHVKRWGTFSQPIKAVIQVQGWIGVVNLFTKAKTTAGRTPPGRSTQSMQWRRPTQKPNHSRVAGCFSPFTPLTSNLTLSERSEGCLHVLWLKKKINRRTRRKTQN